MAGHRSVFHWTISEPDIRSAEIFRPSCCPFWCPNNQLSRYPGRKVTRSHWSFWQLDKSCCAQVNGAMQLYSRHVRLTSAGSLGNARSPSDCELTKHAVHMVLNNFVEIQYPGRSAAQPTLTRSCSCSFLSNHPRQIIRVRFLNCTIDTLPPTRTSTTIRTEIT